MDKCNLKTDEVLGTVSIPVREVLQNNGKVSYTVIFCSASRPGLPLTVFGALVQLEREFPLESSGAVGYVSLRLAFSRAN